jgi:arylsulfatase A-like enzyme
MNRRDALKALGAGAAAVATSRSLLPAAEDTADERRPNVVFIYTDDQPLGMVGCYGGKVLSPHIDGLARDGMRFTRFYVSSPVCSPSRYSALTGRFASRSLKQQRNFPPGGHVNIGWEAGIYGETNALPQVLQENGYVTGMVGKWMQGTRGGIKSVPVDADPADPELQETLKSNYEIIVESIKECGFDYVASAYLQNVGERGAAGQKPGWLPMAMRWHHQEWITHGALQFLEQNQDRPFFLYMPTTLTHSPSPAQSMRQDPRMTPAGFLDEPLDVQPSRESVFERVKEAGFGEWAAGVTWLDDAVGAVLEKLDDLGIADNTVVIFASDNGGRGKFTCYDAGGRMPFVVRWPGVVPAGALNEQLCSNTDLAPTIFEMCGVTPPPELKMDGVTILPALTREGEYEREHVFLEITMERAIVTDDYLKYIAARYPPEIQEQVDRGVRFSHWGLKMDENVHHTYNAEKHYPAYFDADQLYNLKDDPQEQTNLAGDPRYNQKLEEMKRILREYSQRLPHTFGEFRTL